MLILEKEYQGRQIEVIPGDANDRLPRFCQNMSDLDRAVVFLDPYATEVAWTTVQTIARTKKIDCWILFPLMAVARMMPKDKEPDEALAEELDRYSADASTGNRATETHPSCRYLITTRDDNAQRGANRLRIVIGNA